MIGTTNFQEAWSDGLESDVIEFLASVYGVLVLGETLAPDGSILTPALSNSTGSAQGQVPGAGQKAGPGFGSMSQWQGGKQKGTHSGKGSDRDINTVNSSGQKKETQPESGAVLSDFPRRVRKRVILSDTSIVL